MLCQFWDRGGGGMYETLFCVTGADIFGFCDRRGVWILTCVVLYRFCLSVDVKGSAGFRILNKHLFILTLFLNCSCGFLPLGITRELHGSDLFSYN